MAWKNSWSKPASGDSWHCRFSHHTAKPPGFCTNSNTVVISTRELWTAIGDQHLAPGQTPVSYPHWALWNFMDVPTGKRTEKQVFLLILSLTARKSAESLSTNQEKNNAETANTNIQLIPGTYLTHWCLKFINLSLGLCWPSTQSALFSHLCLLISYLS